MNGLLSLLFDTANLKARYFLNTFEGVDAGIPIRRIGNQLNDIAFVAAHVADAQIWLMNVLASFIMNLFEEFAGVRKFSVWLYGRRDF